MRFSKDENIGAAQLARLNEIELTNKNIYDNFQTKWDQLKHIVRR